MTPCFSPKRTTLTSGRRRGGEERAVPCGTESDHPCTTDHTIQCCATREGHWVGLKGSNAYVQTPKACDDHLTFDLRVAGSSVEVWHMRHSKELAQIEEESMEECTTESGMSISAMLYYIPPQKKLKPN